MHNGKRLQRIGRCKKNVIAVDSPTDSCNRNAMKNVKMVDFLAKLFDKSVTFAVDLYPGFREFDLGGYFWNHV